MFRKFASHTSSEAWKSLKLSLMIILWTRKLYIHIRISWMGKKLSAVQFCYPMSRTLRLTFSESDNAFAFYQLPIYPVPTMPSNSKGVHATQCLISIRWSSTLIFDGHRTYVFAWIRHMNNSTWIYRSVHTIWLFSVLMMMQMTSDHELLWLCSFDNDKNHIFFNSFSFVSFGIFRFARILIVIISLRKSD